MVFETQKKKINLVYRTKKIVQAVKALEGKNFEELYFNAISENNIESLAKIILIFAENNDTGLPSFIKVDEVYDFIDDYMEEKKNTYQDIYKEIAEDINNQGFFNKKMTEEEMEKRINSELTLDINQVIQNSAEKAISSIIAPELMGQISKG